MKRYECKNYRIYCLKSLNSLVAIVISVACNLVPKYTVYHGCWRTESNFLIFVLPTQFLRTNFFFLCIPIERIHVLRSFDCLPFFTFRLFRLLVQKRSPLIVSNDVGNSNCRKMWAEFRNRMLQQPNATNETFTRTFMFIDLSTRGYLQFFNNARREVSHYDQFYSNICTQRRGSRDLLQTFL